MLAFRAGAQTSSVNAFSPYTMYGIGEMNTPVPCRCGRWAASGAARTQGGRRQSAQSGFVQHCAAKSFLFDFGVEGQNFYNSQRVTGEEKHTAYNAFNIRDVALSFRWPETRARIESDALQFGRLSHALRPSVFFR